MKFYDEWKKGRGKNKNYFTLHDVELDVIEQKRWCRDLLSVFPNYDFYWLYTLKLHSELVVGSIKNVKKCRGMFYVLLKIMDPIGCTYILTLRDFSVRWQSGICGIWNYHIEEHNLSVKTSVILLKGTCDDFCDYSLVIWTFIL